MLDLLHIENIAVIEEADIQFCPGFNALTGETGAGKSIVIDAMGAVLGGRTSRDLIRTGANKAFVSAEFSAVPGDLPGLAANGVSPDEDGNLLLQREMSLDGKNACRANGRPITVAQLRQIGAELLNIQGCRAARPRGKRRGRVRRRVRRPCRSHRGTRCRAVRRGQWPRNRRCPCR